MGPNTAQLGATTGRGGAFAIFTQAIAVLIQLVNLAVFSRVLAPADFGLVAISSSIIAFISLFRDMGCSAAIVQKEQLDQNTLSGVYLVNIGVATVLMIIALIASPFVSGVFGDPRVTPLVAVSAATILVAAMGAQHSALLRRNLRIITDRSIILISVLVGSVISIALALFTEIGYWALIVNAWLIVLTQTGILWLVSPWRPSWISDWSGTREALKFGLPLTGTELVYFFNRRFDDILIGWRWGVVELGFYTRAYSILMIPQSMISEPASGAIVPALSRLQSDPAAWRAMLLDATRIVALATFLLASLLTVNAQQIVRILLGPNWDMSAAIVSIFGISMFARSLMSANPWIFLSLGKTWRMLRWQLFTTPLFITGMVLGLPYGAQGVALGFSLIHLAIAIPSVIYTTRGNPVKARDLLRVTGPIAVVSAATTLIGLSLNLGNISDGSGLVSSMLPIAATLAIYGTGIAIIVIVDPTARRAFLRSKVWIRQIWGMTFSKGKFE